MNFSIVLRLGLEPRLDVYKTSSLTISRPQGLISKTVQIPKQFIKVSEDSSLIAIYNFIFLFNHCLFN